MNKDLDQIAAEHGTEIQTNEEQDELCATMNYKNELNYLLRLMGALK